MLTKNRGFSQARAGNARLWEREEASQNTVSMDSNIEKRLFSRQSRRQKPTALLGTLRTFPFGTPHENLI
ncbi:MAG: hypothetical protein IJF33_01765 [Clostridia bacterium]|nr:hypothetical protein [Clostridia bacterium]